MDAANQEASRATEQLELAENELRQAGGAVASEAPPPQMAAVVQDPAQRAASSTQEDLASTLEAVRRLAE
eukprot:9548817-Lingulodinium_polyedra.AAC.1